MPNMTIYSETSEQRTHWGQDSCLLYIERLSLSRRLTGWPQPNLELVNRFNAEGCGLQGAESANLVQTHSERGQDKGADRLSEQRMSKA